MVGNHLTSAKAKASLTVTPTSGTETKVGLSDPVVPSGRAIAQRIKATLGITGLSLPRVHIDGEDNIFDFFLQQTYKMNYKL